MRFSRKNSSLTLTLTLPPDQQVLINRRQQSTAGWNIWTTLLDVTGGVLSISQLLLDATLTHDVGKVRPGE